MVLNLEILNLLKILFIAIGLVILFKIEKKIFRNNYYNLSQLLFDHVTIRQISSRIFLIMIYAFLMNFIIKDSQTMLSGIFFGSFLVVWPIIISPKQITLSQFGQSENDFLVMDKSDYIRLLCVYFVFIASSVVFAYLAVELLTVNNIKKELSNWFMNFVWAIIGMNIAGWGENFSSKKIALKNKKIEDSYKD